MSNNPKNIKTNFTAGQISSQLYGRGDLGIYDNGARRLENIIIHPTGGISRRKGLRKIDKLLGKTRLVSFEFNTEQVYLICFSALKARVYSGVTMIAELDTPWDETHLAKLNWTQSADTLLLVHPDIPPKQISRNLDGSWRLEDWAFYTKDNKLYCPYFNFYQHTVKLSASGTSGNINLAADTDIFNEDYIGSRIRIGKGEAEITGVTDAKNVTAVVKVNISDRSATIDWEESVFSKRRGYPISVTFHQDRMVIGGSKGLPNHLWLSKSSDLFNFDIGTGLDDESIDFSILSDQVNAITNVVSTRHLLVFTTGAEWMVTGEPLTPTSIKLNRQTNVGSYNRYSMMPQNVDGATLFISQNGTQLREFLYTDVEQAYQAKDLTLLANDIIKQPSEIVYNQADSILYVLLEDGTVSCLTTYRKEEVNAWSRFSTLGSFISMAVVGDELYVCVKRGEDYYLELFDESFFSDCSSRCHSESAVKTFAGWDYLEGKELSVVADGYTVGKFIVNDGTITLHEAACDVKAGLPYEHIVEPLPYMAESTLPYPPKSLRVVQILFRLLNSKSLRVDCGRGYSEIPFRNMYNDEVSDSPDISYTGDVEMHALGWIRDIEQPMWKIRSDVPGAFTLLAAVTEVKTK